MVKVAGSNPAAPTKALILQAAAKCATSRKMRVRILDVGSGASCARSSTSSTSESKQRTPPPFRLRRSPSGPVSRILSRTAIHLGRTLPCASCGPPGLARATHRPFWPCSGWGLPCAACCQPAGALLPHPFSLACARRPSAVYSLLHFPSPCGVRPLAGILLCGVRTFLCA